MTRPRQAKDISDEKFFAALDEAIRQRSQLENRTYATAFRTDVIDILAGQPLLKGFRRVSEETPAVPPKVVLAKARSLKKRGLLDGCDCGCRGDWKRKPSHSEQDHRKDDKR